VSTRDEYEAALRALPEAHSLALRLHDAGVADEVICGYLHIEAEGLAGQKGHSFRRGAIRSNRDAADFSGTGRPRSDHLIAAKANSGRSLRVPALFEPIPSLSRPTGTCQVSGSTHRLLIVYGREPTMNSKNR
jgi:hypothetical protein